MTDSRPDPDALLAQLKAEEAQARRGRLKIFFGATAGVGKTYAMLSAARAQRAQDVDVVVGVVETHGRQETQSLLGGLEVVPLRDVSYRGHALKEFDLDAVLARKPSLVLVDELAHSNVQGSRHPKRWQDVQELLAAGIDVWTTVNVQHLETLNDVVNGITGVRVWETVPDRVFDEADEVVIVDLPPDDLLQRLKDGKVYMPQQAATAVRNFFRKGNLIALRELALRRTADRVDDDMLHWRRARAVAPVWQTREAMLVCIGPDERADKLVRTGARLAARLDVPWHCVYVETPRLQRLPPARRERVLRLLRVAQESGAETAVLAGSQLAATIVRYAHEHNLPRVVLGRDVQQVARRWRTSLADAVGTLGVDLDVLQVALPRANGDAPTPAAGPRIEPAEDGRRPAWRAYAATLLVCAAAAAVAAPLSAVFELSNVVMVFLLAVVFAAVRHGRGPAVLAAFVGVAAFDFLYVPPRLSFSVTDVQYLVTFSVMLVVGLVIGQLTAVLKWQARVAMLREERVGALYRMSRDLSGALLLEQIAEIAARFLDSEFEARSALLVADLDDRVQEPLPSASAPGKVDRGIAQWAYDHGEPAGQGTHTLPASPVLYLPLKAPMRLRGVLAIEPRNPSRLAGPEQMRLLETCASLVAISLERVHYVDVARESTVHIESERLRNSLLAAISHDLRTPLAALVGMADTLALGGADEARQAGLAKDIRDASLRMSSQVANLLDMARLQSGRVRLSRQWLPLEEAIGTAMQAMSGVLDRRRVSVKLPPDLPMLHVDPGLFDRVLCNLLENAQKHTPPGTPIEIGALESGDRIRILVEDRGPGLPKNREEAIFEMFERGRKESATPGVGLGLAICRAIVAAHDGTIVAENRPGGGARFVIDLPRVEPPALDGIEGAADGDDGPRT
ncbi:MAG: two-component system sensor histidine kinase KdpD [Burkholderiaceae bacterium]